MSSVVLHGRLAEQTVIDALLGRVRQGLSGALVITGEPGIGKTALLGYAAAHSDGMRVLRGTGVESEAELAFAGLHLLLGPVLDHRDRLPDPQRMALSGALGLGPAEAGDRFLIALAVLSLLSELAEARGNPLALIELPAAAGQDDLRGVPGLAPRPLRSLTALPRPARPARPSPSAPRPSPERRPGRPPG